MGRGVLGFELKGCRRWALRWAVAGLVCWALSPPGQALAEERTVQFAPLLGATASANRRDTGFAPITVQIVLANEKAARQICAYSPRLRDAIIVHLVRQPLHQKLSGRLDLAGVGERLKTAMQPTVTAKLSQVIVIDGGIRNSKMATGSAAKLPSSSTGCVLLVE